MKIKVFEMHEAKAYTSNGGVKQHTSSISVEFDVDHLDEKVEEEISKLRARLMLQTYRSAQGMVTDSKETISNFAKGKFGPQIGVSFAEREE